MASAPTVLPPSEGGGGPDPFAGLLQQVREVARGVYDVLDELGHSPSGTVVYLAREIGSGDLVALNLSPANGTNEYGLEVVRTLATTVPGLESSCPECKAVLPDWDRSCFRCGADLTADAGAVDQAVTAQLLQAVKETTADGYEILGQMSRAEGGGVVYFARDKSRGKLVALRLRCDGSEGGEVARSIGAALVRPESAPARPAASREEGFGALAALQRVPRKAWYGVATGAVALVIAVIALSGDEPTVPAQPPAADSAAAPVGVLDTPAPAATRPVQEQPVVTKPPPPVAREPASRPSPTCARTFGRSDWVQAAELCLKEAEAGNRDAQRMMGRLRELGNGVQQDAAQAARWYLKAAAGGDAEAQRRLGYFYRSGSGVRKSEAESARWFRQGAEQGDPISMLEYGVALEAGDGVRKDEPAAAEWYRKAADGGSGAALRRLGRLYERGRGVPKDEAEAARYYEQAGGKGDAEGMYLLGRMYKDGRGVEKSEPAALDWFRKAAALGHRAAADEARRLERPD